MKQERCLQQLTGSCLGCNVLEIAREKIGQEKTPAQAAQSVQSEYCPPGEQMQVRYLNPTISVYLMGQRR